MSSTVTSTLAPPILRLPVPRAPVVSADRSALVLPVHVRRHVLDYLEHNCYGDTLKALRLEMTRRGELEAAAVTVSSTTDETTSNKATRKGKERAVDCVTYEMDATAPMDVVESEVDRDPLRLASRAQIRSLITCGNISHATSLIQAHFPRVLDPSRVAPRPPGWVSSLDPTHISLNLAIQQFIELVRTSGVTKTTDGDVEMQDTSSSSSPQADLNAISFGRNLHLRIESLAHPAYTREWTLVGSLIAYPNAPATAPSDVRGYFSEKRRDRLADQVDRAVLCVVLEDLGRIRLGDVGSAVGVEADMGKHNGLKGTEQLVSTLEHAVRQNSAIWRTCRELGMRLPRSYAAGSSKTNPVSTRTSGNGKEKQVERADVDIILPEGIRPPHVPRPASAAPSSTVQIVDDLVPLFDLREFVASAASRLNQAV